MARPLVPWNVKNFNHENLVWWAVVDNRFQAEVHRTNGYTASLFLFDHQKDDTEIACWEVGLSYGALSAPDIADVELWQNKILDFIDNQLLTSK